MGRLKMETTRVYPMDYMFEKVEKLTDLLENEVIKTNEKVDANEVILNEGLNDLSSKMAEKATVDQVTKPKTIEQVIEKMLNKQTVTIVAYGDSITWGYVPVTGVQTANPYPSYLQTLLRDYYGYSGITVINKGNSGKQSDEFASDSYANEVIALNPDMVIFMCGINDCRGGTSGGVVVPVNDYKNNIALMVSKLPYPFIFMTPTFFQDTEDKKNRFVQYVNAMREMAKKLSVKLVDLHSIVLKDLEVREVAFTDVALDNVHYTDDYYKRIAEFIFAHGLCSADIVVNGERFIDPLSSLFRWKAGLSNYYNSSINPMKNNIFLRNDDANFSELTAYLFATTNDLSLQNLFVPNSSSSPNNSVEVNGVSYSIPLSTPSQTIWKLRDQSIPLKYGLNKIVYKTSNVTAGKLYQLIYGLSVIKREKTVLGTEKKLTGAVSIKADTAGVQKRTKLVSFKDNNFKKLTVKFTPSAQDSGISFGTGSVFKDGAISEYPLAVVLHGGAGVVKLFDLKMNSNSALYNADGTLTFSELATSSATYNMGAENTIDITVNTDNYVVALNGVNLFTLQKSTLNLGVLDVWGYSISTASCTVNEVSISS